MSDLEALKKAHEDLVQKIKDLGPEPPQPSTERRAFPMGKAKAPNQERVKDWEQQVKTYRNYRSKWLKLKTLEVEASNKLYRARLADGWGGYDIV